ncbi:pyrokinin-1 receptor-like isoform X1 [Helicoverpa zea]|uniref:Diapause hormone receptor n=2 Tax=Helicoverpa zea TaxID=7113 RepID=S5LVZ5_HELZE|nr:pyrokinin-1 receptor-like isoform X1 [Helicoverpa zea]AGR34305.1 diapause hormone receptor [Helicoverpa zea]
MSPISEVANLTGNTSEPVDPTVIFGPQRDSLFIVLPVTIVYALIFITGLLGNIFTCLVIVRNKSMHTATNYYLFSLAISDLLLLISGMPQEMYSIWSKWPYVFGHSFCVIRGLAAEASTNASVLTITLFTVERYLAICHPFVSHKMSKLSRATKHVMFLWVAAVGLALPQALQFGLLEHSGVTMCLQTRVIIEHSFEISTFFFFFAPMILITVLYSLIGLKLRETNISKEQSQKDFDTSMRYTHKIRRKHSQSTRRVVKMLVAVVVAFFICWAPFHAQRLVAIYGTTENHYARSPILLSVYSLITYISGVFYYMSTCINPIFYHIMSNKFRDAFKNSMMLWCCRSNEKATAKRCSYTAMAFQRNPTSSGTVNSGNSLKNSLRHETSIRYKSRPHDVRDRCVPTVHVCHNGRTIVTPPLHDYRTCSKHSFQHAMKEEIINNRHSYLDTAMRLANEKRRPCSPVCCTYPSSPTETITVTPDALINNIAEEKRDYSADEPEKYLKEIKLRIIQREKEYG